MDALIFWTAFISTYFFVCVRNSRKLLHTWGCTEIVPQSSCLRGIGSLNPKFHLRKTQWVSDLATSHCIASTVVRIPFHTAAKASRTLFNVWWSTFKLSAVQLCIITEIIPRSLFLFKIEAYNRAQNNGRSTDNVRTDWGVDQSTFRLAGHVDWSQSIVLKMKSVVSIFIVISM